MHILKVCTSRNSIHRDKAHMLKNFPSDKINDTKNTLSFFFRELQLITVLLLICDSYMSWSTRFVPLKLCVEFSVFHSVSFLLKFIFLFHKMHGLLEYFCSMGSSIIPFEIKIIEKPHIVLLPDL